MMNLIALALLIAALVAFGAFHFIPFANYGDHEHFNTTGREFWRETVEIIVALDVSGGVETMIPLTAFLAHSLIVAAAPFLILPLYSSRWLWWLATISSALAMCGLGGFFLYNLNYLSPGPGFYCLLAGLALNFTGLLFIRREAPTISPPP